MCGILVHLGFDPKTALDEGQLKALNDWHRHRGPDEAGVLLQGPVAMGVRRLSIVDLAHGHQPMSTPDGRYTIAFNGEIYNHKELRQKLAARGYAFRTRSDTEVLLYAFADAGPQCLDALNGMFAFCVWDKKEQRLFAARDRLGIKPLYYAINKDRVLFSSELRALVHSGFFDLSWDLKAVSDYLAYWYVCQPRTVFNEIRQLPPGHWAWVEGGRMRMEAWWRMPMGASQDISFNDSCRRLQELLEDSIRLRLQADVPVGIFLSGGIDSGLIAAMAARQGHEQLKAFSIGFKDQSYNELPMAESTAKANGIELHSISLGDLSAQDVQEAIAKLDEPLGNASYVPAYFLSKLAAASVKSVLSGDGGDELFGGYPTYQAIYYQDYWRKVPEAMRNLVRAMARRLPVSHGRISFDYRLKQLMKGIDGDYCFGHYVWRQVAPLEMQRSLMRPDALEALGSYDPQQLGRRYFDEASALSTQNRLMYVDTMTYLVDDHLRKIDRMSMACGLEVRLPYLDYRMVELAMSLPAAYKVDLKRTKIILKHIARPFLPAAVLRGSKKGLTSPIAGWLTGPLKDFGASHIIEEKGSPLFDTRKIKVLWQQHQQRQADHSRLLWALLTFNSWAASLPVKVAL